MDEDICSSFIRILQSKRRRRNNSFEVSSIQTTVVFVDVDARMRLARWSSLQSFALLDGKSKEMIEAKRFGQI